MADAIDFYFSFGSPPGYFASTRIDALAAAHGRSVRWHPIDLREIFAEEGLKPTIAYPKKGAYHLRDWRRTADRHGIPFSGRPEVTTSPSLPAAMVFYRLADRHGDAVAEDFAKRTLHAFFVDHRPIGGADVLTELATAAGGAADDVALDDADGVTRVAAESRRAGEAGVFGSPFVIVDGEPFWGFDRFDQLERWLATGGW